jgi:hypothetical protein
MAHRPAFPRPIAALVALALALALPAPTTAAPGQEVVELAAQIVIETQAHPGPNDPDRCIGRVFIEFPNVRAAVRYAVTVDDLVFGYDGTHVGPPFPDDDYWYGPAHFVAPPGFHRFTLNGLSGGDGCTEVVADLEGRWEIVKATATLRDRCEVAAVGSPSPGGGDDPECRYRVSGLVLDGYGAPYVGVTVRALGSNGGSTDQTNSRGRYVFRLPRGYWKILTVGIPAEKVKVTRDISDLDLRATPRLTVQGDATPKVIALRLDGVPAENGPFWYSAWARDAIDARDCLERVHVTRAANEGAPDVTRLEADLVPPGGKPYCEGRWAARVTHSAGRLDEVTFWLR